MAERNRHPFLALRNEFDRLFDEASSMFRSPMALWGRRPGFGMEPLLRVDEPMDAIIPAVDVDEREADYRLTLEMPGLEDKDIEVGLQDDILTVRAEKKEEKEEKDKNRSVSERRYGVCVRSFQLPANVDPEGITAGLKNGVLTVTLPKTGPTQPAARKIAITQG
ncbi:hypothetical protein TSO352_22985 [Azospirillum sp. TSO35-2]|nr:hypothetical protein TSO352_22985 [Azospirillum sp. TSO35-2]